MRAVAVFWTLIILGTAAGAGYLQYLGPPPVVATDHAMVVPSTAAPAAGIAARPAPAATQTEPTGPAEIIDGGNVAGDGVTGGLAPADLPRGAPIPAPLPALLKASAIDQTWQIPRIGADGLAPMQAYAASQLPPPAAALLPPDVPRVAILVAGLGDDPGLDNLAAGLPAQISLAYSPYGREVTEAAAQARKAGHESVLVLPMPGLLAGYPQRQNQSTLDWSMARFQGFAGVTDAFSPAMGGGFLASEAAKTWLMSTIAKQGLFYIEGDPNAGAVPYTAGRGADIVIDAADGAPDESVKLSALITEADSQHAALGLMLNPTPDALRSLDRWSSTLVNEDVLLVPVSAMIQPPAIPLPINTSLNQ